MKTKIRKVLPKTDSEISNGGIYSQSVRCGKANCKCSRGETHQAYYFFTRINGKLTKTYIRKAQLKKFAEIVDEARYWRQTERQIIKQSNDDIKRIRTYLRENKAEIEKQKQDFLSQLIRDTSQAIKNALEQNPDSGGNNEEN